MVAESAPRQRYIAFLRAINVGGRTVKMDRLRALFTEMGLDDVTTFIASGNVIFEAPAADPQTLEGQIEAHLRAALGYEVATFLRTPAELTAIARYEPFDGRAEGDLQYVGFLAGAPAAAARERVDLLRNAVDDLRVHGREIHWLRRPALGESAVSGAALEKALGMPTTVRNVNTIRKLAAKYGAEDRHG
jgi:uncharacterized protein (DUF1697 family)